MRKLGRFMFGHINTHKDTISKLLSGEEVTFKSDIRGANKNAIKFKTINLNFVINERQNSSLQTEFEKELDSFEIWLTHLGHSYYQCDERAFVITSEAQEINFTLRKNSNGEPFRTNDVYNKLKDGQYMLSPYTMWTAKLLNVSAKASFSRLTQFKDMDIDVELFGNGQYIKENVSDICNSELTNYYMPLYDMPFEKNNFDNQEETAHL